LVALQERTIFYCSNFDLSAEDWISSYHSLQNFISDLKSNLGKLEKSSFKQ